MKIGINLIALYDETGTGAFRYIKQLLKKMGDYAISDCKFYVYKQAQISEEYIGIPSNLNVEYINVPNIGHGIKRIVFEQTLFYFYICKCDIFYSYCTSMPLFVHAKRIFTLHDVYYLSLKERYGNLQRLYLKWITKIYCKRSYSILTVSEFSKMEINKYIKVPLKKIHITYNFVLPLYSKIPKVKKVLDINGIAVDIRQPYFLFVGNLQPGKNIDGMIDGFLEFSKSSTQYNLIVVGKITSTNISLLSNIQKYNNVYYLGYQDRDVVELLYSRCCAVVLLSFCEGFGIPPIEGFLYGKPALASNQTSLPEVVGKAGVLVNPYSLKSIADGYSEIVKNVEYYATFINMQLLKFDPEKSVEAFMDALDIDYRVKN